MWKWVNSCLLSEIGTHSCILLLTYRGRVTHPCVSNLGHDWLKKWLAACAVPSHCLNHVWLIVKCTLEKNFVLAILSEPLCANELIKHNTNILFDSMCQKADKHWGGDVISMKFLSRAAPEVVKNDKFRCGQWGELCLDSGVSISVQVALYDALLAENIKTNHQLCCQYNISCDIKTNKSVPV